jgi:nicotinamide-nucleotide amidase
MLVHSVMPFLRERFGTHEAIYTRVLHTIGIGESEVDRRLDEIFRDSENPKIAVLAHDFRVDVKIMSKSDSAEAAQASIAPLQKEIENRLNGYIFGRDEATPASAVLEMLTERRETVALAESCTGGRIAAALTSVAGSSRSFVGAVVAYDNAVKLGELGVEASAIREHGAVSAQVAKQMARGVRERLHADIGLATTGIAGPQGGTPQKPVGLVWFGLSGNANGEQAWDVHLPGDREAVQQRAVTVALGSLWRYLNGRSPR